MAHVPMFFALNLFNNVIPFSLIFLGQTALGAGLASGLLNATTPFWTILIANQVTQRRKALSGTRSPACCSASPAPRS